MTINTLNQEIDEPVYISRGEWEMDQDGWEMDYLNLTSRDMERIRRVLSVEKDGMTININITFGQANYAILSDIIDNILNFLREERE